MADILYSVYAIAVLIVAAVGLLWVGFSVPGPGSDDTRYQALTVLAAVFILAMIGLFLA
ncbi:MAG: hypothetical protein ACOCR0_00510 [Haloferacaceae archaeon]